jgi:hypothetical protein
VSRNKDVSAFVLVVLIVAVIYSNAIPQCVADIYMTKSTATGGAFASNSSVEMPRAEVWINLTAQRDHPHQISILGEFSIISNVTLNATLAFVYPKDWDFIVSQSSDFSYSIFLDEFQIPVRIMSWLDFASKFGYNETDGEWMASVDYAVCNTTLLEDQTTLLKVEITFTVDVENGYFNAYSLQYVVGSARSFAGNTHQTINVRIEDDYLFSDIRFFPDHHLENSTQGNIIRATWDFHIQDFPENTVVITCEHRPYQGGLPPDPIPDVIRDNLLVVGLIAVSVIIGIGYGIKRGR